MWVIVRKVGQDVYAVRVGDNKILDRDHTQLRPRAPDPSGRPVTFEFTAGDVDSDDEGEDDDFTGEKILTDKPDPGTPGEGLYKVRWKGFAASRDFWEPPSSFVPRYTTVWMDYLRKKNTCWSIWWLQQHRTGSPLALLFVFVLGRRVRAFIRGFRALIGHIPPSLGLHIYISLWYTYLDRWTTFLYLRSPWSML